MNDGPSDRNRRLTTSQEDFRFLTGRGNYVADIQRPGMVSVIQQLADGVQCDAQHKASSYHEDNSYRVEYRRLHGASSLNLLTPYLGSESLTGSHAGNQRHCLWSIPISRMTPANGDGSIISSVGGTGGPAAGNARSKLRRTLGDTDPSALAEESRT